MTKHKRTYNDHCKSKKRNQTDPVVSGVLTLFVVVVSTKSILEILLAHVGSHVSLQARWYMDRIQKWRLCNNYFNSQPRKG